MLKNNIFLNGIYYKIKGELLVPITSQYNDNKFEDELLTNLEKDVILNIASNEWYSNAINIIEQESDNLIILDYQMA